MLIYFIFYRDVLLYFLCLMYEMHYGNSVHYIMYNTQIRIICISNSLIIIHQFFKDFKLKICFYFFHQIFIYSSLMTCYFNLFGNSYPNIVFRALCKEGTLYSSKLESCKALWPLGGTLSLLIVWLKGTNPWSTDETRKNISKTSQSAWTNRWLMSTKKIIQLDNLSS